MASKGLLKKINKGSKYQALRRGRQRGARFSRHQIKMCRLYIRPHLHLNGIQDLGTGTFQGINYRSAGTGGQGCDSIPLKYLSIIQCNLDCLFFSLLSVKFSHSRLYSSREGPSLNG